MKRKHNRKNRLFLPLILMILGISLGYALLSQNLTINGITKVKGNNWSIHFDNVQISSGSVTLSTGDSAAEIDSNDDTLVEYTVTLNTPGDFYEFTVDAVNDGTVDGMIGEIISKLNNTAISTTNPVPSYLDYSVTYADGTAIAANHLLAANTSETYKVRVEFKRDIEETDLPTTDQTNTFSFGVSYVQSDDTAIAVPHPVVEIVYTANTGNTGNINIGSSIPNGITQYATAVEAMAALKVALYSSSDLPFCLKHEVTDDTVTASYVEFVVTSEMANNNPGMATGTYPLRGAGLARLYDEINDEYYFEDIPYEANKTVLQTAFGASNCIDNTTGYSCSVSGLDASASSSGGVGVRVGDFYCIVSVGGNSYCSDGR